MIWGTSALFHEFAHLCGTGCPGSGTSALQPLSLRRGCLGALGVNLPLPGPFDGWAWGCGFGGAWKVETPLVAPVAPSACRSLCVPFCSWPSTGWWVGSSSPGNEPEEGPEGNVGAPALAGQVKNQSVFVPVHKPFKTPKVSISIVYLQPEPPAPRSLCSSLCLDSTGRTLGLAAGASGPGSWARLLQGLQSSCQLQVGIL